MGLRESPGFPGTGKKFGLSLLESFPRKPRLLIGRNLEMIPVFIPVPIHGRFSRAIEEGQKLKVLGMSDRIVLMGMAPGANQGEPEQGSAQAFHPVEIVLGLKLSGDGAPFGSRRVHADKPGCNLLIQRRIGEQVTGKLPSNELIKRKVVVKGPDDPIAIRINPPLVIKGGDRAYLRSERRPTNTLPDALHN